MLLLLLSRFWCRVDSQVDANVSRNHTVSIFRAEVAMLRSRGIYVGLQEGEADGVGPLCRPSLPSRTYMGHQIPEQ
jgi:hypothetical protein